MNIPVNINHLSPEDRTELQVRAMLQVVPERVRKGSYQSALEWKETCRDANKALTMQPGAKRVAAIGRSHLALSALGGVIRENV